MTHKNYVTDVMKFCAWIVKVEKRQEEQRLAEERAVKLLNDCFNYNFMLPKD